MWTMVNGTTAIQLIREIMVIYGSVKPQNEQILVK
jgi:hypothetical protein